MVKLSLKPMSLIIYQIFILLFTLNAQADTTIPEGEISGIWNLAGSPYIIHGNVEIIKGESLTIEPGVIVKFAKGKELESFGSLKAIGTENNPIVFTSDQTTPAPGDWYGIDFFSGSSDSELNNCVVEYANKGIYCTQSPDIVSCTVQNNSEEGIRIVAIASGCDDSFAGPNISGCTIQNNSGVGIAYYGSGSSMWGCTISKTGRVAGNLTGCIIKRNRSYGVSIIADDVFNDMFSHKGIAEPTIKQNQIILNTESGIYINADRTSIELYDNQISQNGGSGVHCEAGNGNVSIVGNTISGNAERGIYNIFEDTYVADNLISGNTLNGVETVHVDTFGGNILHDNSPYDFYYLGENYQNAMFNDWGTEVSSEIDNNIYDNQDDQSIGTVKYELDEATQAENDFTYIIEDFEGNFNKGTISGDIPYGWSVVFDFEPEFEKGNVSHHGQYGLHTNSHINTIETVLTGEPDNIVNLRIQIKAIISGEAMVEFGAEGATGTIKNSQSWYYRLDKDWKTITINDIEIPPNGELPIYINFHVHQSHGTCNFYIDCLSSDDPDLFIQGKQASSNDDNNTDADSNGNDDKSSDDSSSEKGGGGGGGGCFIFEIL